MTEDAVKGHAHDVARAAGLRLRRVIVLETLLIALAGLLVWGIAWDLGYPRQGLVVAIVIWIGVSPVIEIATVNRYYRTLRQASDGGRS